MDRMRNYRPYDFNYITENANWKSLSEQKMLSQSTCRCTDDNFMMGAVNIKFDY